MGENEKEKFRLLFYIMMQIFQNVIEYKNKAMILINGYIFKYTNSVKAY